MSIKIVCINKDNGNHENPHTAIRRLGWVEDGTGNTGYMTRIEMYDWVKGGGVAYVQDAYGNKAYLMTAITSRGTKYVKTIPDETKRDNLLYLSEC